MSFKFDLFYFRLNVKLRTTNDIVTKFHDSNYMDTGIKEKN